LSCAASPWDDLWPPVSGRQKRERTRQSARVAWIHSDGGSGTAVERVPVSCPQSARPRRSSLVGRPSGFASRP
jgi:hypothetical protein